VEVLEECERAVAGEEIYQVSGDGGPKMLASGAALAEAAAAAGACGA